MSGNVRQGGGKIGEWGVHTFTLCRGLEGQVDQFELVDLVGELGDEDLVEG